MGVSVSSVGVGINGGGCVSHLYDRVTLAGKRDRTLLTEVELSSIGLF